MNSCASCPTCSRASRASCLTCFHALRVSWTTCSHASCMFCHTCSRDLCALCPTCSCTSGASCLICPRASCILSVLTAFLCCLCCSCLTFSYAPHLFEFFIAWAKVNDCDMLFLKKESRYNGFFFFLPHYINQFYATGSFL